jgi:hypothetical protein
VCNPTKKQSRPTSSPAIRCYTDFAQLQNAGNDTHQRLIPRCNLAVMHAFPAQSSHMNRKAPHNARMRTSVRGTTFLRGDQTLSFPDTMRMKSVCSAAQTCGDDEWVAILVVNMRLATISTTHDGLRSLVRVGLYHDRATVEVSLPCAPFKSDKREEDIATLVSRLPQLLKTEQRR